MSFKTSSLQPTVASDSPSTAFTTGPEVSAPNDSILQHGARLLGKLADETTAIATTTRAETTAIHTLGPKAATLGRIVDVIREISDQSNLLALNAAIEAARTNGKTRGFAEIAEEIRNLASEANPPPDEIRAVIARLHASSDQAIAEMERVVEQVRNGEISVEEADARIRYIRIEARRVSEALAETSNSFLCWHRDYRNGIDFGMPASPRQNAQSEPKV